MQQPPTASGIDVANWTWKVVRVFVRDRCGRLLSSRSCLNYLHRLDFVLKRPNKRLLKADAEARQAFIAFYAALRAEAQKIGAKIFFVDEAHFRADGDVRAKWVLRGQPALVDSTSPRLAEKTTYYSGICVETGEVEAMEVTGTCTAETSVTFLTQLREKHAESLIIVWDNGPAHHGDAIRTYLKTPDLNLRLVALPAYSPDFNADEAIWDWVRDEVTANTCLGTKARVQEKIDAFFATLAERRADVQRRCRTTLQVQADALASGSGRLVPQPVNVDFTLVSV